MKKLILSLFFITSVLTAFATHIIGGEMRYEYLGPGLAPNSKQYRIRLLLLRGPGGATFQTSYVVGIYSIDDGGKIPGTAANNNWLASQDTTLPLPVPIITPPCIENAPFLDYTYKSYSFVVELPDNLNGYTVVYQTFSRQNSTNVNPNQGANYLCVIPGTNVFPFAYTDNSPRFNLPVTVICENSNFSVDFSATDVDGDSLVYDFCDAYDGGAATNAAFDNPAAPPYNQVIYTLPYNSSIPLGPTATINRFTGIISGISPNAGKYVVCVCVTSYRNGVRIGVHRKDLIVEVSACTPTIANPMPSFTTCDGFNIQFSHTSTGATTVFWDFGDPSTLADTSILDNPTYLYTVAGTYTIKFIINKGGNCTDSAFRTINVFPGFFPGFTALSPFCVGQPVQFTDTTRTNYGTVSNWFWDFGDGTTLADTSHLQDPTYTYGAPGLYTIKLISGNSKGCKDTAYMDITVLATPALSLFPRDTSYCALDSIQLTATGTGNFSWLPATNISNSTSATPLVFPTVPTKYIVTLDLNGCKSRDSVTVTPLNDLTNAIVANPATICREDTLTLTGSSNKTTNISWQWSPAATVESPTSAVTRAYPSLDIAYTLTTRWGAHCIANATVDIPVKQLAIPNAGPDTSFCTGQTAVQISASGGLTYQWTPAAGLDNPNIANPLASPTTTTNYIVAVGVAGCSRTKQDTIVVTVREKPALTLTNDTLICSIDTLQLNATGAGNMVWSPNYNINNTSASNPLVSPDVPTMYHVLLTDIHNCFREDSVFVDVKLVVTVDAGPDTSICKTEGYNLATTSDALHYLWTPPTFLSSDTVKNPFANPPVTTTYHVVANIGKCQSTSDVKIIVAPYPPAFAGNDTAVCVGFNTQITATGGSSYTWTPTIYLSNPNIANPMVIQPMSNILYTVTVTDTLGCTRPIKDSVWVNVIQLLQVDAGPRDTSVVEGETLPLHATGANTYIWSPGTWLSGSNTASPLSAPEDNIEYIVIGTDVNGCKGTDTITVVLYRLDPDMYVPTAFTPNGDGTNDVIRPILLGMRSLDYFKVYNRFGELMFYTTEKEKGWNGIYKGKPQDAATFVWTAAGTTFKGRHITKKGFVVLIR